MIPLALTRAQSMVLSAINEYVADKHEMPTYKQIAAMLGYRSHTGVVRFISELQRKGYLAPRARWQRLAHQIHPSLGLLSEGA